MSLRREVHTAHGAFSWVGLLTRDVERAKRFYADLFGWTADPGATPDERPYCVMRLHGEPVALTYEIAAWQRELGAPTNWATFVSVDDVRKSVALAVGLGASLAIAPYEVNDVARIAVVTDPGGARLSLWQPLAPLAPSRGGGGAGTCCWNELATYDPDEAAAFYAGLFSWEIDIQPSGYGVIGHRGIHQGGIRALDATGPGPARWLPYFLVGSIGETLARCVESGGQAVELSSGGAAAALRDAGGATFGVCARLPFGSGPAGSALASGGEPAAPAA